MAGFGAKLPLSLDVEDGPYTLLKTYQELAQQNLKNLVLTAPGERMMDTFFGVGLRTYLFENKSPNLYNNIKSNIIEQTKTYLPYLEIQEVFFQEDPLNENTLSVEIYFFIKPLNLQDMLAINVDVN
tara:strand:+ start:177 stop:557 length:381 start_codon:yes stop_codon:yes gene_type:complete